MLAEFPTTFDIPIRVPANIGDNSAWFKNTPVYEALVQAAPIMKMVTSNCRSKVVFTAKIKSIKLDPHKPAFRCFKKYNYRRIDPKLIDFLQANLEIYQGEALISESARDIKKAL